MTIDLGFFSPAVVSDSHQDEKSQEDNKMPLEEDQMIEGTEKAEDVKVWEEIPHDFDLNDNLEIFNRFLANDVDSVNARVLDSRKYLENVIKML